MRRLPFEYTLDELKRAAFGVLPKALAERLVSGYERYILSTAEEGWAVHSYKVGRLGYALAVVSDDYRDAFRKWHPEESDRVARLRAMDEEHAFTFIKERFLL